MMFSVLFWYQRNANEPHWNVMLGLWNRCITSSTLACNYLTAKDAPTIPDESKLLWSSMFHYDKRHHQGQYFKEADQTNQTNDVGKTELCYVLLNQCLIRAMMMPPSTDFASSYIFFKSVTMKGWWQITYQDAGSLPTWRKSSGWLSRVWLMPFARTPCSYQYMLSQRFLPVYLFIYLLPRCDADRSNSTWCIWNKWLSWKWIWK